MLTADKSLGTVQLERVENFICGVDLLAHVDSNALHLRLGTYELAAM